MVRNIVKIARLRRVRNEEGQAVTEYILMMALIVSIYLGVSTGLAKMGVAKKLMKTLTGPFAATYQFGHSQAKGYDNGGPINHPRAVGGQDNFKIFFTHKSK